jgi:hypothetical protein
MSRRIEMMIDLECAGPAPNGAIVSIGYCFFALERGTIGPLEGKDCVGRIPVQVQSCVDIGMEIDENTMREFWLKQPDEVRALWGESGAVPIDQALRTLSARYQQNKFGDNYLNIWAYPATYDLSILDRAFVLCKLRPSWGRQQYLCARSALKGIGFDRSTVVIPEQWSTKHVPELDAVRQAIQLQTGLQPFVLPFSPCMDA